MGGLIELQLESLALGGWVGGWVGYLVHRKTGMTFSSSILLLHSSGVMNMSEKAWFAYTRKTWVGGWVGGFEFIGAVG